MQGERTGAVRRALGVVAITTLAALAVPQGAAAAEGDLTFVEREVDGADGVNGLSGANGVVVSPDGDFVYVAGRFDNSVTVFNRDPVSGAVEHERTYVDGAPDGLFAARRLALSPSGEHLYVTGMEDDAVVAFSRDADGLLTHLETEFDSASVERGMDRALDVEVSPDGEHVYVAGENDDAITIFDRDPATGLLTFVDTVFDTEPGIEGLNGVVGVEVTPDGNHLYATSYLNNSVVAFARDPDTGVLAFLEAELDGTGGVDGLAGADGPEISADGRHVYTSGDVDDSVSVFGRDAATGLLNFLEFEDDGVNGVNGLNGATLLALSPDQKHLYAPGEFDDALAQFSRDPVTGALAFEQVYLDTLPGVTPGLNGAEGVAVSPDGRSVYVGSNVNALAVFTRVADTTPPETTLTSSPPPASTDTTPSFAFTSAEPFLAGFECRLDAGAFGPCSGSGEHTAAPPLADGPHEFAVRALDTAGNPDPSPATASFAIDTTAPESAFTKQPKNKVRTKKKRAKVRFAWSASEAASFECALDRKPFAPCGERAKLKVKAKGGKGRKHTFSVRATDALGNAETSPAVDKFRAVRRRAR